MTLALVALGALAAGLLWAWILTDHPRLAFGLALAVLIAVPVWAEVRQGVPTPLSPFTIASIFVLPAAVRHTRFVLNGVDIGLIVFAGLAALGPRLGDAPAYASATVFVQWVPAYLIGRLMTQRVGLEWVYRALAICGAIVGAWAIVEALFSIHLFQNFVGTPGAVSWQEIQLRGTFERSEGAFGHAIALGGFLALTAPFILAARISPLARTFALLLTGLGAVATFSRGPILGFAVALVFASFVLGTNEVSRAYIRRLRVAMIVAGPIAAIAVTRLFQSVSDDLTVSTAYRASLPQFILQDFAFYGIADNFGANVFGQFFYRSFSSIDNAYILIGLQFGWIPLGILVAGLAAFGIRTLRGSATPAVVAMTAQIVVLGTVALITQYSSAVWLVVGIAAAEIAEQRSRVTTESPTRRSLRPPAQRVLMEARSRPTDPTRSPAR